MQILICFLYFWFKAALSPWCHAADADETSAGAADLSRVLQGLSPSHRQIPSNLFFLECWFKIALSPWRCAADVLDTVPNATNRSLCRRRSGGHHQTVSGLLRSAKTALLASVLCIRRRPYINRHHQFICLIPRGSGDSSGINP